MKHKHRIVPGYEGGEYTESNVVHLTPTQHAMWHFAEWQRKGRWQDRVAWRGLAGLASSEESRLEAMSNAWKCRKTTKHSDLTRKKLSESKRGRPGHKHSQESKAKISSALAGRTKSEEHRRNHAESIAHYWTIVSPDGHIYEVRNLRAFCREHDLNQGAMNQVGLGKKKSYKGWTCAKARND